MCIESQRAPYHPKGIDFSSTKRVQGKQTRMFLIQWLQDYHWLSFCVTRNRVFCFYCRLAALCGTIKSDISFTSHGYDNWKKATTKFREHEKSRNHLDVCSLYKALQQPSVATRLSLQVSREQKIHRELLIKQFTSLQFLMRQGLAVCGHTESEGNLAQLLKCRSEDVSTLKEWLSNGKYRSPDILNEQIQLMAHQLLRQLISDITAVEWFAIIADETRDLSGKEQFAICICWVDMNYDIHEDLIGLVQVDATDAATLASNIKDVLLRVTLKLSNCVGQAYDGASNMAGRLNGVAQIF